MTLGGSLRTRNSVDEVIESNDVLAVHEYLPLVVIIAVIFFFINIKEEIVETLKSETCDLLASSWCRESPHSRWPSHSIVLMVMLLIWMLLFVLLFLLILLSMVLLLMLMVLLLMLRTSAMLVIVMRPLLHPRDCDCDCDCDETSSPSFLHSLVKEDASAGWTETFGFEIRRGRQIASIILKHETAKLQMKSTSSIRQQSTTYALNCMQVSQITTISAVLDTALIAKFRHQRCESTRE